MSFLEFGKGILFIIGGIIYFKFFNQPYLDKKTENKWREMGDSEQLINASKYSSQLQYIIGFFCGVGSFIVGFLYIYNELARSFGWALLFVDK